MILGCVLAGGQSTRFGSDKALAQLGDVSLLDHTVATLSQCCDAVVVVGRADAPAPCLPDRPRPGMGPLGGIAAALHHAQEQGHSAVLTAGVDTLGLPLDLIERLSPPPAYLADQPVVGLWPAAAAGDIDAILAGLGKHSLRAFATRIGARAVTLAQTPANINTAADLAAWETDHGL